MATTEKTKSYESEKRIYDSRMAKLNTEYVAKYLKANKIEKEGRALLVKARALREDADRELDRKSFEVPTEELYRLEEEERVSKYEDGENCNLFYR